MFMVSAFSLLVQRPLLSLLVKLKTLMVDIMKHTTVPPHMTESCMVRATYDLGERLYAFIDTLPEDEWPVVGYSRDRYNVYVHARCSNAHRVNDETQCLTLVNKAQPNNTVNRLTGVDRCVNSPWMLRNVSCGRSNCYGNDITRSLHMWTHLGRIATTHSPISFTHKFHSIDWLACFMCQSTSDTEVFCGGRACTVCIVAFINFSRALWAIKRLLPLDVARYIGGYFVAVNLAMIPEQTNH